MTFSYDVRRDARDSGSRIIFPYFDAAACDALYPASSAPISETSKGRKGVDRETVIIARRSSAPNLKREAIR